MNNIVKRIDNFIAPFMFKHSRIYELSISLKLDSLYNNIYYLQYLQSKTSETKPGSKNNKKYIIEYPEGFKIALNGDIQHDPYFLESGSSKSYDVNTTSCIRKILRHGETFIDVGANIGYFSLLASKLVGEEGKVYSFEPTPSIFRKFEDNIKLNKLHNIMGYRTALADKDGKKELYVTGGTTDSFVKLNDEQRAIKVDVARLDTVLYKKIKKLKMIKIDVEGYEEEVILGGEKILKKFKPFIVFEFNYKMLFNKDKRYNQVFDALQNLGYSEFMEIDTNRKIKRYSDLTRRGSNILASH